MLLGELKHEKMTAISPENIIITNVESPITRDFIPHFDSTDTPHLP